MADCSETWSDLLHEAWVSYALRVINESSPFLEGLAQELEEMKARDRAYLDSLSPFERKRVLLHRRIDKVERRYEQWWATNVSWRFAPRHPDWEDEGW